MPNSNALRRLKNFDPSRNCFACGPDHPIGLHMVFETDGSRLFSRLTIPSDYAGWDGIAHGGIVTAVLDEIMSWSAHHLMRKLILTKSIQAEFLKPVPVEEPIRAEGWVESVTSDREAVMASAVYDARERLCARGSGVFALFTTKAARRMGVIDERIISGFERYFESDS
ncbi:MAG: PaaI family thioesterase [Desulfobacterales bacterium]